MIDSPSYGSIVSSPGFAPVTFWIGRIFLAIRYCRGVLGWRETRRFWDGIRLPNIVFDAGISGGLGHFGWIGRLGNRLVFCLANLYLFCSFVAFAWSFQSRAELPRCRKYPPESRIRHRLVFSLQNGWIAGKAVQFHPHVTTERMLPPHQAHIPVIFWLTMGYFNLGMVKSRDVRPMLL